MSDYHKIEKADRLRRRLEFELGEKSSDVLSDFRKWLDKNDIKAEDEDGFPSEEAYLNENIYIIEKTNQSVKI